MVGQEARTDKERQEKDSEIMRMEVKKNEDTKETEEIKKCWCGAVLSAHILYIFPLVCPCMALLIKMSSL